MVRFCKKVRAKQLNDSNSIRYILDYPFYLKILFTDSTVIGTRLRCVVSMLDSTLVSQSADCASQIFGCLVDN